MSGCRGLPQRLPADNRMVIVPFRAVPVGDIAVRP
jgi:hypothetical protein